MTVTDPYREIARQHTISSTHRLASIPVEVKSFFLGESSETITSEPTEASELADTATLELKDKTATTREAIEMLMNLSIGENNQGKPININSNLNGEKINVGTIQNKLSTYIRNKFAWYHPEASNIATEYGGLIKHELVGIEMYFTGYLGLIDQMLRTPRANREGTWHDTLAEFREKMNSGRDVLLRLFNIIGSSELSHNNISSDDLLHTFLPHQYYDDSGNNRVTIIGEIKDLSGKEFFIIRTLLKNALEQKGAKITININQSRQGDKIVRITDNSGIEWTEELMAGVTEAFELGRQNPDCPLIVEKRGLTRMVPFILGQTAASFSPADTSIYLLLPLLTKVDPKTKQKSVEIRFPAKKPSP